jgi:hypothetical protein
MTQKNTMMDRINAKTIQETISKVPKEVNGDGMSNGGWFMSSAH